MKILLVSQYFWPESFRVNDLVEAWSERGHEVTVLTGIPNYPGGAPFEGYTAFGPATERFGKSKVVRVPLLPRGKKSRFRLALNYLSFVITASLLGPLRCRGPYDCIFVFQLSPVTVGLPAALLRRLSGTPMAFWIQDLWPESLSAVGAIRSEPILRIVGRLAEWIYGRCDLLLVQSASFVPVVISRGMPADRVEHFPNWCETLYQPIELDSGSAAKAALPRGFVVLFAGNLGDAQSLETVVAAADLVQAQTDIQFVFLGDGRRRAWLEEEIAARGGDTNLHWLGLRPTTEMPQWFAAADALLVTLGAGPAMAQTIPGKVQSYLACGRPILAAIDGEGAGVVEDSGAGRVGPAEDAVVLAQNAVELSKTTHEERAEMGRQGRDYYLAHFEREALLDRLDGWLMELTKRSGSSSAGTSR